MDLSVRHLRVENHDSGLGIDEARPRLSAQVHGSPSARFVAYEVERRTDDAVEVAGPFPAGDLLYVPWPFADLIPRSAADVRMRVRDGNDAPSAWSDPVHIERGLGAGDWMARPVEADREEAADSDRRPALLRREFSLSARPTRARLYVTAHGLYEIEINGRRVGTETLAPGWTSYDSRLVYRTFDVTEHLVAGENAIGAWLADGWYRGRLGFSGGNRNLYGSDQSLIAQLEVTTADGVATTIATDEHWRAGHGPILFSGIYDGEEYDAREAQTGFSSPGFDDSSWLPVRLGERSATTLVAPDGPPIRVTETLSPVSIDVRDGGARLLLDFGQNHSGRIRITGSGFRGSAVTIRHAEILQEGELYVRPLRTARATDTYTFADDERMSWEPRFTFHGYRYVEVSGEPAVLAGLTFSSSVIHTDMERIGWFDCSDPLVRRLHENVVWSLRSNAVGIPSDCPQRDERLGWTGDLQIFAPTASFLYDTSGMFSTWLRDLASEQKDDGTVPWFVPEIPGREKWTPARPGAVWGDAAVLTPWDLWWAFGDRAVLERQWDSAAAWVDLMVRRADDSGLWTGDFQLGDWLDPAAPPDDPARATTDPDLVANAYFSWSARQLARTAEVLGRPEDAARYRAVGERVRDALLERYLDAEGRLANESQTGYSLLLCMDLLRTPEQQETSAARLRALVEKSGHRIATGFAGTPLVSRALTIAGAVDTAYRQLLETECPSWLFPVLQGATTIWERWDSQRPDGTVNPGQMTSFNHYALGAVADWLHGTVAGIAPAAPGYRRIAFRPRPGGGMTWARGAHRTPLGLASIEWRLDGDSMSLDMTIPLGAIGELTLPDGSVEELPPGRHLRETALQAGREQEASR